MLIVSLIVFALIICGMYFMGNLNPDEISRDLDKMMENNPSGMSITRQANKVQKDIKDNFLVRTLKDIRTILGFMGQSNKFIIVCAISIVLSIVGIIIAVTMGNPYLIPAFITGFASLPLIFVRVYSYSYARRLQNELELSLSQITISYLRTDNIIKAVEENMDNINPPVRNVFEEFLTQVKFINPNVRQAIDELAEKIDDDIFKEWCEELKDCNQNRTLKYLLSPTVDKFATLRTIVNSLKDELFSIKMQFFIIVGIVFANYPLLYFMNKDWFEILTDTTQGLILAGVLALLTVICTIILSFITKPIKYKI